MQLADAFIQSDLHCIQLIFFSSCIPWESKLMVLVLQKVIEVIFLSLLESNLVQSLFSKSKA